MLKKAFKYSKAGQPCRLIPMLRNLGRWLCVPSFQTVCLFTCILIGPFTGKHKKILLFLLRQGPLIIILFQTGFHAGLNPNVAKAGDIEC